MASNAAVVSPVGTDVPVAASWEPVDGELADGGGVDVALDVAVDEATAVIV